MTMFFSVLAIDFPTQYINVNMHTYTVICCSFVRGEQLCEIISKLGLTVRDSHEIMLQVWDCGRYEHQGMLKSERHPLRTAYGRSIK